MADILLIQPKVGENEVLYAPLGLLALAAYVEKDFSVKIIDTRLENHSEQAILNELQSKPLLVGITVLTGGQILYGLNISRFVKQKFPEIPIVWGGVHPTSLPEQTLSNPDIDFVIRNEGEATLLELARSLEKRSSFENIRGLSYKKNGEIFINPPRDLLDINSLPQPAWHLIDVPKYIEALSISHKDRPLNITSTRGCPFRCKFCYNISFNNRKWRAKNAEIVVQEISMLARKFGVNHLIFHDDLFTVSRSRALKVARMLSMEGLNIKWTITHRVDHFEKDFLSEMKDFGLYQVRVGAESGSQRILDLLNKDITVEQIIESAKISRELNLSVLYSFMIGIPGETEQDIVKTIDLAFKLLEINPKARIYPLWIYVPYPGTPLYEVAMEQGFVPLKSLEEWGRYSWDKVNIPWVENASKLEDMHTLSKFAFYNRSFSEIFKSHEAGARLKGRIMLRRASASIVNKWAKFRFKRSFWLFPYEHRFLEYIMTKI